VTDALIPTRRRTGTAIGSLALMRAAGREFSGGGIGFSGPGRVVFLCG